MWAHLYPKTNSIYISFIPFIISHRLNQRGFSFFHFFLYFFSFFFPQFVNWSWYRDKADLAAFPKNYDWDGSFFAYINPIKPELESGVPVNFEQSLSENLSLISDNFGIETTPPIVPLASIKIEILFFTYCRLYLYYPNTVHILFTIGIQRDIQYKLRWY